MFKKHNYADHVSHDISSQRAVTDSLGHMSRNSELYKLGNSYAHSVFTTFKTEERRKVKLQDTLMLAVFPLPFM